MEKTMIKGLKPFEHRPAPSQNPLLRTQWMPELAPRLLLFLATNQLNYIIATWGQLVVPCIWSQPARASIERLSMYKFKIPTFVYRIPIDKYQRKVNGVHPLQVIQLLDNFKEFNKKLSLSFKGPLFSTIIKSPAVGQVNGLRLGSQKLKVEQYSSDHSQDPTY